MGLSHEQYAEHLKGLTPVPVETEEEPAEDRPPCKHGCPTMPCRHTRTEDKHKKHIGRELRGIPLVGSGPGAIAGTMPGPGATGANLEQEARELEQAGRDLVRRSLDRSKYRPEETP